MRSLPLCRTVQWEGVRARADINENSGGGTIGQKNRNLTPIDLIFRVLLPFLRHFEKNLGGMGHVPPFPLCPPMGRGGFSAFSIFDRSVL